MAKRQNTISQAILAIAKAARADASGTLTAAEKETVVNKAMDVLENSDAITAAEYQQEAIDERLAMEAAEAEAEADHDQDQGQD